jgi:hypothetical protein
MARGAFPVVLLTLGALVVPAGAAALDVPRAQVQIESRFVAIREATLDDLGFHPGVARATVTCPQGYVATSAGDGTTGLGIHASAYPGGPRAWTFTLTNLTPEAVDRALVRAACARIVDGPALRVATGSTAVSVPAAEASGTGIEPGIAGVTGTCAPGSQPTGAGIGGPDATAVTVAGSAPLDRRRWKVDLRNGAPVEADVRVAVRCVQGPGGFLLLQPDLEVSLPGAAGPGLYGEATVTQRCPSGTRLLGGGFRVPEGAYVESVVPTLARIPVLRALFRNGNESAADAELFVICTPRVLR